MAWNRLIRFTDDAGKQHFGEPCIQKGSELAELYDKGELYATELCGDDAFSLSAAPGEKVHVKTLDGVLTPSDIPTIKCIGLNYAKHIHESGRKPPPYPSMFIKTSASLASFNDDIPIPKIVQLPEQLDYEGELAVVIGKTGKDIPEYQALEYVAGYASSNDLSSRSWQRDPAYAGVVPQWCFSKGFDKFCPIGPMLVSPKVVGAADSLQLQTRVNGEERQNSNTNDLIFGVEKVISFLSQGQTLERGTVILTGTPAGVALGMANPTYLKDGDVVEVTIEELGTVRNRMVFE